MAEDKVVKIGFCGVGGMGQCAHLRNYVVDGGCDVVAIAEVREKTGRKVAERYGVEKFYTTAEEMLEKEELDGIVASQPFNRHGILLPELLKAGIPIFTEKPLSSTVESGEKIVQAVKDSGTWHMVGYHKRSDPASMYAKKLTDELKESGELGKLRYVRILMPAGDWIAGGFNVMINEGDSAPEFEFEPAPTDMDEGTYGSYMSFVNYYIHQVNLMRYFLGESYKVTYADPTGVMLAGASDSGVACTIEMTPYATSIDWQETALIAFERGYIKVTLPAPLAYNRPGQVEILKDPGGKTPEVIHPQLPWTHAMAQQALNFMQAIKGEREPMCEAEEALEDLLVAREYIRMLTGK